MEKDIDTYYNKEDILEQLFILYERPMYYFALKITEDPYMADEVVQDAFCKLIKYFDRINYADERETKGYLLTIVKTCAADVFRKKNILEAVTKPLDENVLNMKDSLDMDGDIGEMSFDGHIGEFVLKLREDDQNILYLKYGRDASDEEIADILNLKTTEAVRKRLSRARYRLKNLLGCNEGKCGTNGRKQ